jgi:D-tyrosyl-tRNA(Tyr) deacylase
MRAVVQRAHAARVEVGDELVGEIGPGLVAFVGAGKDDTDRDLAYVADKIVNLRVLGDEAGKMNRSVLDTGGGVLIVSQFTVYGDVRRGRRPGFDEAMAPAQAERAYQRFVDMVRATGVPVATGRFQAAMRVVVDNDGPVTILIDSAKRF